MAKVGIVASAGAAGLNASVTRYIMIAASTIQPPTAEGQAQRAQRSAGVLSKLYMRVVTNGITATTTVRTRIAGANGNQVITFASGATGEAIDASNTDTVTSGQLINLSAVAGGSGTSLVFTQAGCAFAATTDTVQVHGSGHSNATAASTQSFHRYNGSAMLSGTETSPCLFKNKVAGTLKYLAINVSTNARSSSTVHDIRVNGAGSALTVTVSSGATGIFEDTTHSVSVASGDTLGRSITTGSGSGNYVSFCTNEFITTSSSTQEVCSDTQTIAASTTSYAGISGQQLNTTTESETQRSVLADCIASLGEAYVSANTTSATSNVTLRKNAADTALTFAIGSGATGWFEDTTHTVSYGVATPDKINWKIVTGSGGSVTLEHYGLKLDYTANVTTLTATVPETVLSNTFFTVTGQVLLNGVLDTSYSSGVSIALASGGGSITGSTLTATASGGNFSFTAIKVTGGGNHTFTVTKTGTGETVTSSATNIRETPYATTGAYMAQQVITDTDQGLQHKANIFVPAGASAGTPVKLLFYMSGTYTVGDPSTNGSAGTPLPTYIAANTGTFPMMFVNMGFATGANPVGNYAYVQAMGELRARLIADGFNISETGWYGWSTGGINGYYVIARYAPSFLAFAVLVDPSITASNLANDKFLASSFADPGPDNLATAVIDELARLLYVNRVGLLLVYSSYANGNPPPPGKSRNIFSQNEMVAALNALGGNVQQVTYNSGTTQPAVSTSRRYAQIFHNIAYGPNDHPDVDQDASNSTNWPGNTQPWIMAQVKAGAFGRLLSSSLNRLVRS